MFKVAAKNGSIRWDEVKRDYVPMDSILEFDNLTDALSEYLSFIQDGDVKVSLTYKPKKEN